MKDIYQVLRRPHLTEKSVRLKNEARFVVFEVHSDADKSEIALAVEKLFNVKVDAVKIVKVPSKQRRMGRFMGRRPGYKKAIVKLKAGEKMIEYFDNL